MLKIFIITHGLFLLFGILLLFYYAKTGYKLNREVFKSAQKARVPKVVKGYAILLLAWIAIVSSYFFLQILS